MFWNSSQKSHLRYIQFVQAYLGRGNALLDMNTEISRQLSKRDFLRAIHIDPTFTPAYHNLAIRLYDLHTISL